MKRVNQSCPISYCQKQFNFQHELNSHLKSHKHDLHFCHKCRMIVEDYDDHIVSSDHRKRKFQQQDLIYENGERISIEEQVTLRDIFSGTIETNENNTLNDSDGDFFEEESNEADEHIDRTHIREYLLFKHKHKRIIDWKTILTQLNALPTHSCFPFSSNDEAFLFDWLQESAIGSIQANKLLKYLHMHTNIELKSVSYESLCEKSQRSPELVS